MESGTPGAPEVRQITVGLAQLTVARQGHGGTPAVVLLHSGITDHRSWLGVMGLLAPDTDVVAYDRRGFGTTTCTAEGHDQVDDLCAVLDALGLGQVVLVGNSQGGQIALAATLARPERVGALVLVAPAVAGAPEVSEADLDPAEAAIWETLEVADAAGALDALNLGEIRLWLDGPGAPEGRVGGPARDLALAMNRVALHAESPGHEPDPPDVWSRLPGVAVPTLAVAGDLDMRHMVARTAAVAAHIPGAAFRVMPGAAHLPAFEQPDAFVALLRPFLAGLDEPG